VSGSEWIASYANNVAGSLTRILQERAQAQVRAPFNFPTRERLFGKGRNQRGFARLEG